MKIYTDGKFHSTNGTCIALGSFDALHTAHMKLIDAAVNYAKENNLESGVYQFLQRPAFALNPNKEHKIIYTNEHKNKILEGTDVDFTYYEKFDSEFMKMSCEDFALMLKNKFFVKCVVVGFHYTFGYKGMGDCKLLSELGKKIGFEVIVIDAVKIDGVLVSSTAIREFIKNGEIVKAEKFLGRPYSIYSKIEHDRGVGGSLLKIPTANLVADERIVLPLSGVYAGFVNYKGKVYPAVTNVGTRPTFDLEKIKVESHILDFNEDIYDENIEVFFLQRIRDEIKFDDFEKLKMQILSDIDKVKNIVYNKLG